MSVLDETALRALIADEVRRVLREEIGRLAEHDEYLSIASAARVAEVTPDTIRAWIREGRLGEHWAGRERRVLRSELERALATPPPRSDSDVSPEEAARRFLARRDANRGTGADRPSSGRQKTGRE